MPAKIDLTGVRFGRLTAVETVRVPRATGSFRRLWRCRCDCGGETTTASASLKNGTTSSCGCLQLERVTKHGHAPFRHSQRNRTYQTWLSMIQRCTNPNATAYHRYGGRGIAVCERWRDYRNFLSDMGERPDKNHTLERINNDRSYEPGNTRWATRREQSVNRSSNRLVRYDNRSQTVIEWVRELGLDEELVRARLKRGWPFDKIINTARRSSRNSPRIANGRFAPSS